jgi:uncharacterized SAM-binding protein YcdF (DUF218 family)
MYHALEDLLRPSVLLFLFLGLAIANLWRKRRESRGRLVAVTVPYVLLYLMFMPVIDYLILIPLERPYPRTTKLAERPEVLVVLSGYIYAPDDGDAERVELGVDTLARCIHALRLYRKFHRCPILVSGGRSIGAPKGPRLAEAMRDFFREQGVPASDLIVEDQSNNTHENAGDSAPLLRERGFGRIVLVTDAIHMRRASLCFEKLGFEVVPSAATSYTERFRHDWTSYLPSPRGATRFLEGVHEWVGLAYYKLRGWI